MVQATHFLIVLIFFSILIKFFHLSDFIVDFMNFAGSLQYCGLIES